MTPRIAAAALATVLLGPWVNVPGEARCAADAAPRQETTLAIEEEATRAIASDDYPFTAWTDLVARLRRASGQAPDAEAAGRLALLWLRGLRRLLAAIPMDGAQRPPYRDWIAANERIALYSEPAGAFLIVPELIWRVHDAHRATASAEAIAWLATENGLSGECEGYVPCYAHGLDRLFGEYLRSHPQGKHGPEAALAIQESCEQSLRLLSGPDGSEFLDVTRDCAELSLRLDAIRHALVASTASRRFEAIASLDQIRAFCP